MSERMHQGSSATPADESPQGAWSETAVRVLRERYLQKDEHGTVIESPDAMCWRVARAIASAEATNSGKSAEEVEAAAARYADLMLTRRFMPNSPTLMNAGKGNNLQLSACFVIPVEDSLEGIFESVKHAAIVHQSGGGCIAGDAHIFTTFCGVESISVLYDRVKATGKAEEIHDDHAVMDVQDLAIRTMALNPATGAYEMAQVTHLWRYDVPLDDQVRVTGSNGLEVTTSCWHPFMVFDGTALVERRADELQPGDILPAPNASVRDQWPHHEYREVAGIRLDEEIAWLLGYYLGDGSMGWVKVPYSEPRQEKLRWRLFDGRTASLEFARDVLARRFGVELTIQLDARGLYSLNTTNPRFIAQFRDLLEVHPGPKGELPFPEMVAKSPLTVVGAFLAGLVDSDGHVEAERDRVTITSQSYYLMSKIHTLCALLGLAPGLRSREPHGKGRTMLYDVKLAAEARVADLRDLIGPMLHDELKSARLAEAAHNHAHSTAERLPIPFAAIEDILQSIGIQTKTTEIHRQPMQIGGESFWLHRWKQGQGVGTEWLPQLIATLRPLVAPEYQPRLDVLERLMQGATTVQSIAKPEMSIPFYDFTVADHSTYLAGKHGLTAIHNTGFSFSRLRPQGSMVSSTHGVASGPVSFMKIFDQATDSVKQGGSRRGANMGILRVDHPDVEEFITCKLNGGITNFNISVAITDAFMSALERDEAYDLVDPHTQQVTGTRRARAIFDKIVQAAWASGDPGLVFLDRANHSTANPIPEIELLEATNPCVVGETRIATSKGLQRMDALFANQEALVVATDSRVPGQFVDKLVMGGEPLRETTGVVFHEAVPVYRTDIGVPVWKLITSHGIEITATPNHRFLTTTGYKRMDTLEYGDEILLQSAEGGWSQDRSLPEITLGLRSETRMKARQAKGTIEPPEEWSQELGEMVGYIVGDGWIRYETGIEQDVLGIAVDKQDEQLVETLRERLIKWFGIKGNVTERQGHYQMMTSGTPATFFKCLGISAAKAHEKRVPDSIFTAPRDAVVGFLRGLFSADGSVQIGQTNGSCSVRLATSSKGLALDVQQILLNFGIVSSVKLRREEQVRFMPNAQRELAGYVTKAQYELFLDKINRDRFAELAGFMQPRKQQKLVDWIGAKKQGSLAEKFVTKVATIEEAGEADVYDTTVENTHSVIFTGIITAQCGEQWLGPYDACNLGSINLGLFVRDGQVDWAGIEETTRTCTRFLDDVIDVNPYPLAEIREKVRNNRRIGLGVMGWADMLFQLGIRYDSDEAIHLAERVMVSVRDWSTDESIRMANERGAFANWERSIYKHDAPRRNSTCTTVAPTGSISIIADCSSGIEPIFALAFQHRVKQPDGTYRVLDFVNPFFVSALEASDASDKAGVLAWVREHGALHGHPAAHHPDLMPYVTAHEVAPEWHIRMQAAFQKGVDNSISKTINLPNSATYEDVENAYLMAWQLGCLGITVFRDGSKGEQVLNVGVKKDEKAAQVAEAQAANSAPLVGDPLMAENPPALPVQVTPVVALPIAEAAPTPARTRHSGSYTNGVKDRPEVVHGYTRQVRAPEGKVNVTLNSDDDGLLEVFIAIGKAGSDVAALAEGLGRLISLHLRVESPLSQNERAQAIAEQLQAIGGSSSIGLGMNRVRSLPDAVARALMQHLEGATDRSDGAGEGASAPASSGASAGSGIPVRPVSKPLTVIGNLCPQCGCNTLVYAEGCKKCLSCGYSEC